MPKIVINEYDLTKAGTGEYSNFSVVVPGFLAEDKYTEVDGEYQLSAVSKAVFDENGIYECSSQTDFVNNVGKCAATFVTRSVASGNEAEPPTVSAVLKYSPNLAGDITTKYEAATVDAPETFKYKNYSDFVKVYNAAARGFRPTSTNMVPAIMEEGGSSDFKTYYAVENERGIAGELATVNSKFIEVVLSDLGNVILPSAIEAMDDQELDLQGYDAPTQTEYFIIANSEMGVNGSYAEDRISHYGNQMAYELLGLGYTVLFKALIPYTEAEVAALCAKSANLVSPEADETGAVYLAPSVSAAGKQLSDINFWNCLKDKSTYDFRYLVTGLLTENDGANKCILEVADHSEEILLDDASIDDGRGDCIALIDLDSKCYAGKTQSEAIPYIAKEAAEWSSAYAAVFAPYVTYLMSDDIEYNNNKTFPATFHYLACAANSSNNNFSEWYANAGYTRGVAKYTIESTGCKFGEIAIQSLEPRFLLKVGQELNKTGDEYIDINTSVAVNLIVKIKSSYYLWGNRTGKKLGTRGASDGDLVAQHFLNIRQLCTTIKKQVYVTCRRLTFDPNSNILWINFRDLLTPMLEQMKADQGIKDYKIVKNATDRKALLSAKIRIVPIEAVEDFEIGLYLEDTLDEVALTEA